MLVSLPALVSGLRGGRVGSFPTDTVPALAVRPDCREQIYALKQRPAEKPLILMGADMDQLWAFIDTNHPAFSHWQRIANQYLPGALTLVLPANDRGKQLNSKFTNLGIRIPQNQGAIAVLQQTGVLLTTSANLSDSAPIVNMQQISDTFPEVLVWSGARDNQAADTPSTVVAWERDQWVILRQGAVEFNSVEKSEAV
ncbi:MAG: L-threonylcarbamoyladenylate synthase [Pseudanabaenaceae cyanobacterium]